METGQPYAYAEDDPVNGVDPDGLDCGIFSVVCGAYDSTAGSVKEGWHDVDSLGHQASHGATAAWRLVVDVPQDAAYLLYWGNYEAIRYTIGFLSCNFGLAGNIVGHVITAPLVIPESAGLGGDVLGNVLKGETVWQEGQSHQPLLGNESIPFTNINAGRDVSHDGGPSG